MDLSIVAQTLKVYHKSLNMPWDLFKTCHFLMGMGVFFQTTNWEVSAACSLPMLQAGGHRSMILPRMKGWATPLSLPARLNLYGKLAIKHLLLCVWKKIPIPSKLPSCSLILSYAKDSPSTSGSGCISFLYSSPTYFTIISSYSHNPICGLWYQVAFKRLLLREVIANECEAIPGPDLAFMNVVTERHSCRISGNSSIFKSRRARAGSIG